jgi:hypothetical protein
MLYHACCISSKTFTADSLHTDWSVAACEGWVYDDARDGCHDMIHHHVNAREPCHLCSCHARAHVATQCAHAEEACPQQSPPATCSPSTHRPLFRSHPCPSSLPPLLPPPPPPPRPPPPPAPSRPLQRVTEEAGGLRCKFLEVAQVPGDGGKAGWSSSRLLPLDALSLAANATRKPNACVRACVRAYRCECVGVDMGW